MSRAYSSVVVSHRHAAIGAVLALAVAGTVRYTAGVPSWAAAAVAAVLLATAFQVSTVRLVVGADHISLGLGTLGFGKPCPSRLIATTSVTDAHVEDLSWPQVFGLGLPWSRRTTRLTVRSGPTLALRLQGGETVRVSTADPRLAVQLLRGHLREKGTPDE